MTEPAIIDAEFEVVSPPRGDVCRPLPWRRRFYLRKGWRKVLALVLLISLTRALAALSDHEPRRPIEIVPVAAPGNHG